MGLIVPSIFRFLPCRIELKRYILTLRWNLLDACFMARLMVRLDVQEEVVMSKLTNIIPVSDLRQEAAKLLKQLNESKDPLIITQRGRAAAVIMGVDAYEESEQEKELLRLLVKGDKEIEMGDGYDLNTVLADADAILVAET